MVGVACWFVMSLCVVVCRCCLLKFGCNVLLNVAAGVVVCDVSCVS